MNTKKAPELRIKRTNVYVPGRMLKGWSAKSIDRNIDVLQYRDETGEWIDIPVDYTETLRVYKDRVERDAY